MDKLTSILVVADDTRSAVLFKAEFLAGHFGARVDRMAPDGADALLRRLEEAPADLVMKPAAGKSPLSRWSREGGDRRLAELCPVPLMLVNDRPWPEELRVAAAVDVSERETEAVARGILQTAGFLTLGTQAHLDVLYAERELDDGPTRMARAVKVAALVREFRVGCERPEILDGPPEKLLPPLLANREYDLLVLGAVTHRDGLLANWQGLTGMLAEASGADLLLVKAREPAVSSRAALAPAQAVPSN